MEDKKTEKLKGEYLIIFDEELNIVNMLNFSNNLCEKGIFDVEKKLYYIEADIKLFFEIKDLLKENTVKLDKKPTGPITINNIIKTPLPPKPLTKEEIVDKALLEQTLQITDLSKKTKGLATGVMDGVIGQVHIENKINALSRALLELTMKGMK